MERKSAGEAPSCLCRRQALFLLGPCPGPLHGAPWAAACAQSPSACPLSAHTSTPHTCSRTCTHMHPAHCPHSTKRCGRAGVGGRVQALVCVPVSLPGSRCHPGSVTITGVWHECKRMCALYGTIVAETGLPLSRSICVHVGVHMSWGCVWVIVCLCRGVSTCTYKLRVSHPPSLLGGV